MSNKELLSHRITIKGQNNHSVKYIQKDYSECYNVLFVSKHLNHKINKNIFEVNFNIFNVIYLDP